MCLEEPVQVRVVMPLHDQREFVVRAVTSVLTQARRDLELVVVDDGSTDGGAELLTTIRDPRLQILQTRRRGPGAARNLGARGARTRWLAFIDADDEWQPTFLEKALAAARGDPPPVVVFCDAYARGLAPRRPTLGSGLLSDYYEARMRHQVSVSSSSNLIHAGNFRTIGGFPEEYHYAEDVVTWFRLACQGPFYFIAEPLCVIERTGGVSAHQASPLERAAGLQHLWDSFAELERRGAIPGERLSACRRFMRHQRGRQAVHLAAGGERFEALRLLMKVPLNADTWRDWARCIRLTMSPRFI
jgi:hypothetical protein